MPETERIPSALVAAGRCLRASALALWKLRLLVLAAFAVAGVSWSYSLRESHDLDALSSRRDSAGEAAFFTAGGPDSINFLRIQHPGGERLHLRREDDGWSVHTGTEWLPVSATRQASLFEGPGGLDEIWRGVSGVYQGERGPDAERLFTGTPGAGALVEFYDGARLLESIELGRTVTRYGREATFVTRPGAAGIHILTANLLDNFCGPSPLDWIDRRLLPVIDPRDVEELSVLLPGGEGWTLRRSLGAWQVEDAQGAHLGTAVEDRADRAVASVLGMEIMDLSPLGREDTADTPAIEIRMVESRTGLAHVIRLAQEPEGLHAHLPRLPGEVVWVLPPAAALRPAEELLAPPRADALASALQG